MDGLRPLIRKHAHALLDRALGTGAGELDVHRDYASPLPRLVMMDFLGITGDELSSSFASMSRVNIVDCFGPRVTPELRAAANDAIQNSMDHVARLYEKRRQEPRDDLLTHLVQAKDEGGELSHGELITLFSTIFGSGASTTSVLASGILELARPTRAGRPLPQRSGTLEARRLRGDPPLPPGHHLRGAEVGGCAGGLRPRVRKGRADRRRPRPPPTGIPRAGRIPSASTSAATRPSCRSRSAWGAHFCLGHAMAAGDPRGGARLLRRALRRAGSLANEPRWIPFVMENKLDRLLVGFEGRS
jgi:hypothetical protein